MQKVNYMSYDPEWESLEKNFEKNKKINFIQNGLSLSYFLIIIGKILPN